MNILIVDSTRIPALKYGGTERVIWGLGKALTELGHSVSYMAAAGSVCPFATQMLIYDEKKKFKEQVPENIDVVHFNWLPADWEDYKKPFVFTLHGNINHPCKLSDNTVFISSNQALRHGGKDFVHNGLDWSMYRSPNLKDSRSGSYFHFLGNASWKVKNVKGAIQITKEAGEQLAVMGGNRLNLNMGLRFTTDRHVRFFGKVDDEQKAAVLNKSRGLVFPALWHEPFGLAIIESLFFGCPVFATAYGSLPELVTDEVGFLSNCLSDLASALKRADRYNRSTCSEYAADNFSSTVMAKNYLLKYERVLSGERIQNKTPEITTRMLEENKVQTLP